MSNGETNVFCSDCKPYPLVVLILVLACLLIAGPTLAKTPAKPQADNHAPILSSDHEVASAGFFQLSWETDAKRIELQEASSPAFRNPTTLYIGTDSKSVISGKPNGSWYYRVRALVVHESPSRD